MNKKEALLDLYKNLHIDNLEEGYEEDQTPFTTSVKLKEAFEQLPQLTQLEEETPKEKQPETYGKTEEKPLVGVFKKLEIVAEDKKGKIHKIGAVDKGVLHAEKLQKKEENPDLICLCSIGRTKIYYNQVSDEFWKLNLKPVWISHKRTMTIESWDKLEPHDFETMKMLGILYERNFENPLSRRYYIKKKDRRKAEQIKRKWDNDG